MPTTRASGLVFRRKMMFSWNGLPRRRILNKGRPIFSDKTNPSPQSNIYAGRPTARRPSAGNAVRHRLSSSLQRKPLRAIQGGNFRKRPVPSTALSPKKIFSRLSCQVARTQKKRKDVRVTPGEGAKKAAEKEKGPLRMEAVLKRGKAPEKEPF